MQNNLLKIFFIADICGESGRNAVKSLLPGIKSEEKIDLVIANCENATHGMGLNQTHYRELKESGIDFITMGNHTWEKEDIVTVLKNNDIVRPANFSKRNPGTGFNIIALNSTHKIAIVNLIGQVFMQPSNSPFETIDDILEKVLKKTNLILVDFHAEATSEKLTMGYFLSGKVSAVIGTHTHVQTSDERILDNFTGYITDAGMTGSTESVLGMDKEVALKRFLTGRKEKYKIAESKAVEIQGVFVLIDPSTGRCSEIIRKKIKVI